MRIMIDTNVVISAALFPNSEVARVVWDISLKHELVLCSYSIEELHEVFKRKFNTKMNVLDEFLTELSYELAFTPSIINKENYPDIRDPKDLPILVSSIISDVDMLLTGDKDFHVLSIEKPLIVKPNDYFNYFKQNKNNE